MKMDLAMKDSSKRCEQRFNSEVACGIMRKTNLGIWKEA